MSNDKDQIYDLMNEFNKKYLQLVELGYKVQIYSNLEYIEKSYLNGSIIDLNVVDGYYSFKFSINAYSKKESTFIEIKKRFDILDVEIKRLIKLKSENLLNS